MTSPKIAVLVLVALLVVGCRSVTTATAKPSPGTSAPGTSAPGAIVLELLLGTFTSELSRGTSAAGPSPSPGTSSSAPRSSPGQALRPSPVAGASSAAPPPGAATWAWCSSAPLGTKNTSDGYDLYNNEWNSAAAGPQTICGNSGADWQVTSTQGGADPTSVKTYPSVQKNYPDEAVGQFTKMTSSYAESMPSGGDFEAAYDIWLNGLSKEVMFWVDNHGQAPAGTKRAAITLGGLTWDLYATGQGYWAFVLDHNASSGSVDLLAGLRYLLSTGALSASDKLWQVNFGWEICSTAGVPEVFRVTSYSVTSSPAGAR